MKKIIFSISIVMVILSVISIYYMEGFIIFFKDHDYNEIPIITYDDLTDIYDLTLYKNETISMDNMNTAFDDENSNYYIYNIENSTFRTKAGFKIVRISTIGDVDRIITYNNRYYKEYNFITTSIPIINVNTVKKDKNNESIVSVEVIDEYDKNTYYTEFKIRGGVSRNYEKKSYTVKAIDNQKMDILNLGDNSKFVLNSLYEDDSKIRDVLAWDIWSNMQSDNTTYNRINAQMKHVELVMDNKYQGLYCLQQYINETVVDFQEEEEGTIYKVISWEMPEGLPPNKKLWSGVEINYSNRPTDMKWDDFADLLNVVNNNCGDTFNKEIAEIVNMNNIIDYYLFTELIYARDNTWKNMFLSFRDSELTVIPWDLDISFGLNWSGEAPYYVYYDHKEPQWTLYGASNNNQLIQKMLYHDTNNIKKLSAARYFELRENVFAKENLIEVLSSYESTLNESGALIRDRERWPNSAYSNNNELLRNFISIRTDFLDAYFEGILDNE